MNLKRDIIINGEMVDAMQTLQNFGDLNVNKLISKTKEIHKKYKNQLDEFILLTKKISDKKESK